MKKTLIAQAAQHQELAQAHPALLEDCQVLAPGQPLPALAPGHLLIDLCYEQHPQLLPQYLALQGVTVVLGNLLTPLYKQVAQAGVPVLCQLYGLNALPGALGRSAWEMCAFADHPQQLPVPMAVHWVADEAGLVTPRVLAMIINEAYYMLQEGTADAQAIDTAMLLGVNYPKGPLAWAQEIGPGYVARLLMALNQETGQEKYAPCRLLRREAYPA
jgi:3-hydroxybutyryl-CoA dehydrogenase